MLIKTLAEFKRRIKDAFDNGKLIQTTHTKMGDFGIRSVSICQSNSFALKTKRGDELVDSWCEFPKAGDFEGGDNEVKIFWGEGDRREHILTYKFLENESK
jgi:hypothetical protein